MRFDFPATAAITVIAVVATLSWLGAGEAGFAGALVADRELIEAGQLWRLFTGPFVHATPGHLIRDLVVVVVIGVAYEKPLRPILGWLLALSLAVPTAAVLLYEPVAGYLGLSGMSHCFIAAAITYEVIVRPPEKRPLAIAIAVAFAAKLIYEQTAGPSVIPTSLGEGASPAPLAHAAGAVCAIVLVALASSTWSRRPSRRGVRELDRR